MHNECIDVSEFGMPENLWESSDNAKAMLLP